MSDVSVTVGVNTKTGVVLLKGKSEKNSMLVGLTPEAARNLAAGLCEAANTIEPKEKLN